jgi:phage/plasmid-like protein (TIGR03299 family)
VEALELVQFQHRPLTFARTKETTMGLLDAVLDATARGATVISERHDPKGINWARGMSDPGEMIACGYLPEARRLEGESDHDYQIRLENMDLPEGVLDQFKAAAIRRASLDRSNGKISAAFAGKAAWHELGVVVDRPMRSGEAIKFGSMDWTVTKRPLYFSWGDDIHADPDAFAVVREDTGAYLGTVGKNTQVIQNQMAFEYVDGLLEEYGARYESVGAVYGGKKIWLLAEMPEHRFSIDGDENDLYVLFMNPHDGSGAAKCFPTSMRVECANTMRLANKDAKKGITIRHTGSLKAKMAEARDALGLAVNGFEEYKEGAEVLARTPCLVKPYVEGVLDAVLEVTAAEALKGSDALAAALKVSDAGRELAAKRFEREIKRRENVLEDILSRYDQGRCHPQGTAWAAFNSVTEHADHNSIGRKKGTTEEKASRRLESILGGERDEMKQVAYENALAMAL